MTSKTEPTPLNGEENEDVDPDGKRVTDTEPSKSPGSKRRAIKSILELLEYSYGENGKKLNFARRDVAELTVDPDSAAAELEAVQTLATRDQLLAVPLSILVALVEAQPETLVRRRVLDLMVVAIASHSIFEGLRQRVSDPRIQAFLKAAEVSEAVENVAFGAAGVELDGSGLTPVNRERLRVNAVTTYELIGVLRNNWSLEHFVEDMSSLVWNNPAQPTGPRAAAKMAAGRSVEALSQVSRHFEKLLIASNQRTADARAAVIQQSLLTEAAKAGSAAIVAELATEKRRVDDLLIHIDELAERIEAEKSSRVVNNSHLVDDYEALRTQVIRRLSAQVELLGDGLHALRHGSLGVAEEFLDRSLSAIKGEVVRLKEMEEGER